MAGGSTSGGAGGGTPRQPATAASRSAAHYLDLEAKTAAEGGWLLRRAARGRAQAACDAEASTEACTAAMACCDDGMAVEWRGARLGAPC